MDTSSHTLQALFAQLGLEDSQEAIDRFIAEHRGLEQGTVLADAAFWSDAQAAFIRDALAEDADWAEVVDQLDAMLRN